MECEWGPQLVGKQRVFFWLFNHRPLINSISVGFLFNFILFLLFLNWPEVSSPPFPNKYPENESWFHDGLNSRRIFFSTLWSIDHRSIQLPGPWAKVFCIFCRHEGQKWSDDERLVEVVTKRGDFKMITKICSFVSSSFLHIHSDSKEDTVESSDIINRR